MGRRYPAPTEQDTGRRGTTRPGVLLLGVRNLPYVWGTPPSATRGLLLAFRRTSGWINWPVGINDISIRNGEIVQANQVISGEVIEFTEKD